MSRFQKLFLASLLVVAGFTVAKFLGQPVLSKELLASRSVPPPSTSALVQSPDATVGAPQASKSVRLLPDSPMAHVGAPATSASAAPAQPPRLGNALAPVVAVNDGDNNRAMPRDFDFGPILSAPTADSRSPRARLRNEAPRPLGVDPQSPAAIRRLPSETDQVSDPYQVADSKAPPPAWPAPPLLNADYTAITPAPPTALPASYAAPVNFPSENQAANQVAPPPWPVPEEAAEPRTHIVVDGDSLERLASRYLSDPQRGREIYELNRDLLSAPDLLPIGVELKIPERVASATRDRSGFQPNSTNGKLISEIGPKNTTQARPTFAPQGIIPRAQLAPPVMVQ